MSQWPLYGRIDGPIVMIGFGSIGKGTLPLIERHFEFDRTRFVVIDPNDTDRRLLDERGVKYVQLGLTRDNYRDVLGKYLRAGEGQGFCVNLSVDTSSLDIMRYCREIGALYIDTVVEPWPGFYYAKDLGNESRTNYALRETVMAERRKNPGGSTAVSCCGANPGMVSWFVKQALVNLSADLGDRIAGAENARRVGATRSAARRQGRAYRRARHPARQEPEAAQRVRQHLVDRGLPVRGHAAGRTRLGHAREMDARRTPASTRPAAARRSTSTSPAPTPACAPGRRRRGASSASSSPITSRSRSPTTTRFATTRARRSTARPATTPITPATTRCCRCTNCSAAPGQIQTAHHILGEAEIVDGIDELGVLLYGHARNAYWYGSQLSVEETRALAPYQNATGMQVTSAVLAGMVWALENPKAGIVEADEIDFRRCLEVQTPYLGPVVGVYTDWTPLDDRPGLFPEDIDESDPWQFRNVLVR